MALNIKDGGGASRDLKTTVVSSEHIPAHILNDGSGTVIVPLTDTQLRANPVPVSGTVTITDGSGPVTVDGTVGVSGTVAVSGPLTDAQLRAAAVPISGTVTITDGSGPVSVDGTVAVSGTVTTTDATVAATPAKYLSGLSTNATSVKGSAGTLFGLTVINTTATIYYLKFYNKASAPTVGTDIPVLTIPIPASTSGAGVNLWPSKGIAFSTGIAFALTSGIADNDTGNANVGVAINLAYV